MNEGGWTCALEGTTHRAGLTLIEMLVATAATLLLVLAVTQSFAVVSEIISVNRAALEMAGQLRGTTQRLQRDLDSITAPSGPWLDSEAGQGYFEYIEGLGSDALPAMFRMGVTPVGTLPAGSQFGDVDDIIMFTARSTVEPFVGTICPVDPARPTICIPRTIESDTAEVMWWSVLQDENRNEVWDVGESFKLHRRALLVKPELNDPTTGVLPFELLSRYTPFTPLTLNRFYNENDVSVRPVIDPSNGMTIGFRANSLSDLTLRQNRFAHYPVDVTTALPTFLNIARSDLYLAAFPFEIDLRPASPTSLHNLVQWGVNRGPDNAWGRIGQDDNFDGVEDNVSEAGDADSDDLHGFQLGHDIILPNLLAFDVRAYDVTAPLSISSGQEAVLVPGDPGWVFNPDPLTRIGTGAYVDLNYLRYYQPQQLPLTLSQFSDIPRSFLDRNGNLIKDATEPGLRLPTYDTWPLDYERDGINQDFDVDANDVTQVDEGVDGLDNNNFGGVDDISERETRPPYAATLRGIQIRIRIQDPDSRQVRQQTVNAAR